jgi:hypothetical protein
MSRVIMKPNASKEITELVVGYDRPLGSWFFQVFNGEDADGEPVIVADKWGDSISVANAIMEYADISNKFNKAILVSVIQDICPQVKYGTTQFLDWETTKIDNSKSGEEK